MFLIVEIEKNKDKNIERLKLLKKKKLNNFKISKEKM